MRRAETILARATMAFLVVYVPAETYVSWSATACGLGCFALTLWMLARSERVAAPSVEV